MRVMYASVSQPAVSPHPLAACIGYFDGMHLGHQALIQKTLELAKQNQIEPALITFDPDPWVTIKGLKEVHHITTMRQRVNMAVEYGIKNIIILRFTKEMSELSPEDFLQKILIPCNIRQLVCGFDFHYGYLGKGDTASLQKEAPFPVTVIPEVTDEMGKISSTRISQLIEQGRMEEVSKLLGYPYIIEGTVVHGHQQGRLIGFPTANVKYSSENILPRAGVYAGYVKVNRKSWRAMINLGHNPTFNYSNELSLEAYILDFNEQIYDLPIEVSFVRYLRPEHQFKCIDNLILQMEQDLRDTRKILK